MERESVGYVIPEGTRPYPRSILRRDKDYLHALIVGWWNGESDDFLESTAKRFKRNPNKIRPTIDRLYATLDVKLPLTVLAELGVDLAPLSPEEIKKIDLELGI